MQKGVSLLKFIVPALTCTVIFSSCSLLPVEEEAPPPPLIRSYEKTEYKLADVVKGDMTKSLRISCQYSPALEETLSFKVGGVLIESVYVENGDTVKKGDVIAELDRDSLTAQIDTQSLALDKLKLSRSQLTDAYRLNLETETVKLDSLRDDLKNASDAQKEALERQVAAQEKTVKTLTNNYELQLDVFNTRINAASSKLSDLKTQSDARVLIAGIDGTVTYIKETDPNSTSVENEKFVTIADKTSSVFIISGDEASYFKPGDAVSVLLSNAQHDATVIDAAELGLKKSDKLAYVRLNETAFDIKERATGSITLVLDRRDNVLQVTKSAVKSANGKSIVYMLDASGIKIMREIETGFEGDNNMIEVVSGLEAGEKVIIE